MFSTIQFCYLHSLSLDPYLHFFSVHQEQRLKKMSNIFETISLVYLSCKPNKCGNRICCQFLGEGDLVNDALMAE